MLNIKFQCQDAITNILAAKLRSVLTLLAISIGTAAVVAMLLGGKIATSETLSQFKTLGTDLLAITINPTLQNNGNNKLTLAKAIKLQQSSNAIIKLAPYTSIFTPISFADRPIQAGTIGVTENFFNIVKAQLFQGRIIYQVDNTMHFCVIGNNIYQQLKPYTANPLGKQLNLGPDLFTIVGILKPWPENSFINAAVNNAIFVPIKTIPRLSKYAAINNIILKLVPNTHLKKLTTNINRYFAINAPGKQLSIRSAKQLISSMTKQKQTLTILLGFIGTISLLVGGIGIMNLMLITVNERKGEIGIRLAVGAKCSDIRALFLLEAMLLTLIGAILGVLVGVAAAFIIAHMKHWHFHLYLAPPLLGFSAAIITGIFFGSYPAYQASKLTPIEALRSK
ncbi:MAG: ABC transporter permease [Gammaproteobacteria bacterium]|nr:ABC transporter permease [Gammaproteobacteria bacterium]